MLIKSNYYPNERIEKCWFESSNVFYSEFHEDETKNEGDLFVTFNNGATYKYKKVQMAPDYLMFKHGGLEGSHGKALNVHIKPKYEFEKCENKNTDELIKEKEELILSQQKEKLSKTYFVSGHRDITEEEFHINYKPILDEIIQNNPDSYFVIGDYHGADIMTQNYLIENNFNPAQITVYHMGDEIQNINPNIVNVVGGFETDEERDTAMTLNSSIDIAFVRDNTKISGTAQNILRRFLFKN